MPVQHHHVERRLAALVAQGGIDVLLGPSGLWLGSPRREEALGVGCEGGKAGGDEDEARRGRLDQKRDKFGCNYMSSGDIDVISLVEDGANVGKVVCKVGSIKSSAYLFKQNQSHVSHIFFDKTFPSGAN